MWEKGGVKKIVPTYSDSLPLVLFLFGLESQFNEELLQFLVTVVDTELFEAVDSKDLEPVDVQETHQAALHSFLPKRNYWDENLYDIPVNMYTDMPLHSK